MLTMAETRIIVNWMNSYFDFGDPYNCFYCGQSGAARDHVIPHSFLSPAKKRNFNNGLFTTSCGHCNSILGNMFYPSLRDRVAYINARLYRKLKMELEYPDWEEHELEELSFSLRHKINDNLKKKQLAQQRIGWQATPQFIGLWEQSYKNALVEHPNNWRLHLFMIPPWRKIPSQWLLDDSAEESLSLIPPKNENGVLTTCAPLTRSGSGSCGN